MDGIYIYVLTAQHGRKVRYVGQTGNPRLRLIAHVSRGKQLVRGLKAKTPLDLWLKKLAVRGREPRLKIVEVVDCGWFQCKLNCASYCKKAFQIEQQIIKRFQSPLLLNRYLTRPAKEVYYGA